MVIGIFVISLKEIVVNVANGEFSLNTSNVHGLKLQVGKSACGILGKGLVDADADLSPYLPFT